MNEVKIGDVTTEFIPGLNCKLTGTVFWIHPENRYYRVRFESKIGFFNEAFLIGRNKC